MSGTIEMFKLTGILGETYSEMGNHKIAIELFKKAAEECIEEFGDSSSERIQALSSLAAAHSHDGGSFSRTKHVFPY